MFELGQSTGAQVIVEGIETENEFEHLVNLGITYGQGYFLAKPAIIPRLVYPGTISSKVKVRSSGKLSYTE